MPLNLNSEQCKRTERKSTYVTQTAVEIVCVHRCDFESRQRNLNRDATRALNVLADSETEQSPLAGIFSLEYLKENSNDWNFRQLPPKFSVTKDLKQSNWIYVVAKGALSCSSKIPIIDFPKMYQSYLYESKTNAENEKEKNSISVNLATYIRGQCLGISSCNKSTSYITNSKNDEDDGLMESIKFLDENIFIEKYPLQVDTDGESEVLMIHKKMIKNLISDELFWCLASQYETKKFPKLKEVIDITLDSIEWVKYRNQEYGERVKYEKLKKNYKQTT